MTAETFCSSCNRCSSLLKCPSSILAQFSVIRRCSRKKKKQKKQRFSTGKLSNYQKTSKLVTTIFMTAVRFLSMLKIWKFLHHSVIQIFMTVSSVSSFQLLSHSTIYFKVCRFFIFDSSSILGKFSERSRQLAFRKSNARVWRNCIHFSPPKNFRNAILSIPSRLDFFPLLYVGTDEWEKLKNLFSDNVKCRRY